MVTSPQSTPNLLLGVKKTLGEALFNKVTSCSILVIGSGGIGCELLKNLALSGFKNVQVIDLDTIDVSNLNRQFLFRREHVGMSKCEVACKAVLSMSPYHQDEVKYIPHHGNVFDNTRFNVQYISSFDVVLNALDNIAARRRVNRLCLAASVPLIEAGTTGYLGQVTVIDKASNVECYECQTKPTQKVYPICTIRSTPSMPVHTIVWAKELYKLCFGPKVEDSMLFEDESAEDGEKSTYMDSILKLRSLLKSENAMKELLEASSDVIISLYNTEIQKQLDMDRFKTAQKVPTPISTPLIKKIISEKYDKELPPSSRPTYKQTDIWSIEDCIFETVALIIEAASIYRKNDGSSLPPEFDKDDVFAMRLVTATSNLRSYVFGIEPIQSYYSAKGIAGNIIPAIATTNAIVAGLQVLQAFHILQKKVENKVGELSEVCSYTYCLRDKTRKGFYLQPTALPKPNPKCFVCRNAVINLTLNTNKWTLDMLLRRIVKKELGFMEPTIMIGSDIIHEEGEGADEDDFAMNLPKALVNLPAGGVKHGTMMKIEDFTQDLEIDICIFQKDVWEPKEGEDGVSDEIENFSIGGNIPVASEGVKVSNLDSEENEEIKENGATDDDVVVQDDDIEIVIEDDDEPTNSSKKRSRDDDLPTDNEAKKLKQS